MKHIVASGKRPLGWEQAYTTTGQRCLSLLVFSPSFAKTVISHYGAACPKARRGRFRAPSCVSVRRPAMLLSSSYNSAVVLSILADL